MVANVFKHIASHNLPYGAHAVQSYDSKAFHCVSQVSSDEYPAKDTRQIGLVAKNLLVTN